MKSSSSNTGAKQPPAPPAGTRTVQLWVVVLGFVVVLLQSLLPPLQSPDEFAHLVRAYSLLSGDLVMKRPAEQPYAGVTVDAGLIQYFRAYERIPYNQGNRVSAEEAVRAGEVRWQNTPHFSIAPGAAYYMPLIYLPQAIGLATGKRLDWTVAQSYTLARWLTLAASMALLLMAFRWHPPNALQLALVCLPMALFQWASPSLDGLTLALTLWCGALFMHLMGQDRPGTSVLLSALSVGLLLLATCRIHLLPMVFLLGVLALRQRWRQAWFAMAIVLALSLGWTAIVTSASYIARGTAEIGTTGAILHYLAHPGELIGAFARTLGNSDVLSFYGRSFVGILGWLDAPLPDPAYPLLGGLFLVVFLLGLPYAGNPHQRASRLWLGGLALTSVMLIFLALLLTWNPLSPPVIEGVQGRYFIIPVALLSFALAEPLSPGGSGWRQRGLQWSLLTLVMLSIGFSIHTLVNRYYLSPQPIAPQPSVFSTL